MDVPSGIQSTEQTALPTANVRCHETPPTPESRTKDATAQLRGVNSTSELYKQLLSCSTATFTRVLVARSDERLAHERHAADMQTLTTHAFACVEERERLQQELHELKAAFDAVAEAHSSKTLRTQLQLDSSNLRLDDLEREISDTGVSHQNSVNSLPQPAVASRDTIASSTRKPRM